MMIVLFVPWLLTLGINPRLTWALFCVFLTPLIVRLFTEVKLNREIQKECVDSKLFLTNSLMGWIIVTKDSKRIIGVVESSHKTFRQIVREIKINEDEIIKNIGNKFNII